MEGISGIFSLLTLLALIAPYVAPDVFWPPLFAAYSFIYLIIFQLFLLGVWILRPDRGIWITVITLLVSIPTLTRHMQIGRQVTTECTPTSITTLNAHGLRELWAPRKGNAPFAVDKARINTLYTDQNSPDILCLQEVPVAYKERPDDWGYKKGQVARFRNSIIFTRFPIITQGNQTFENSKNALHWVEIKTQDGPMRIYNIHLQSNSITQDADSLIQRPIQKGRTWRDTRSILRRVREATLLRAKQARWLHQHLDSLTIPFILAGDFNDTPQSYSVHRIAGDLNDSFCAGGTGFGTTFAGSIPGLRIDYILGSEAVNFTHHQVDKTAYSDHYPVSARFCLSALPSGN